MATRSEAAASAASAPPTPEAQMKELLWAKHAELWQKLKDLVNDADFKIIADIPQDPNSVEYIDWYHVNKDKIERLRTRISQLGEKQEAFVWIYARYASLSWLNEADVKELDDKIGLLKKFFETVLVKPGPRTRQNFQEPQTTTRERYLTPDIDVISRTNIGLVKNLWLLWEDASAKKNGYWLTEIWGKHYVLKAALESGWSNLSPVYLAEIKSSLVTANDNFHELKKQLDTLSFAKAELNDSSLSSTWDISDITKAVTDIPFGQLTATWIAEAIILKLWALGTRYRLWPLDLPLYKQKIVNWLNTIPWLSKLWSHNIGKAIIASAVTALLVNIFFTDRDLVRGDLEWFFNASQDRSAYKPSPAAATSSGNGPSSKVDVKDLLDRLWAKK